MLGRQHARQRAFLVLPERPAPAAVTVAQRDGLPIASDPQAGRPSWLLPTNFRTFHSRGCLPQVLRPAPLSCLIPELLGAEPGARLPKSWAPSGPPATCSPTPPSRLATSALILHGIFVTFSDGTWDVALTNEASVLRCFLCL